LVNSHEDYYISPSFYNKMVLHITKNFMNIPRIKVPLILGIWGGKGQGKTFQSDLVYRKLGINPIVMSAGELESGNAGEPAKLVRQRYRELQQSPRWFFSKSSTTCSKDMRLLVLL
jgi:predicted ATPase